MALAAVARASEGKALAALLAGSTAVLAALISHRGDAEQQAAGQPPLKAFREIYRYTECGWMIEVEKGKRPKP